VVVASERAYGGIGGDRADDAHGSGRVVCTPLYEVSVAVTNGTMDVISLADEPADGGSATVRDCLSQNSCSALYPEGGIRMILSSGDNDNGPSGTPFHYACRGDDSSQAADLVVGPAGIQYRGVCEFWMDLDWPITATFDG
jgi:hypothetical protein